MVNILLIYGKWWLIIVFSGWWCNNHHNNSGYNTSNSGSMMGIWWDNNIYICVYLVGGAMCPSWKMMEFVNGKDDIPYMENKIHVWNHQPVWENYLGIHYSLQVWEYHIVSNPHLFFSEISDNYIKKSNDGYDQQTQHTFHQVASIKAKISHGYM